MLAILMGWKQQISAEQLNCDAPDRPYICEFVPLTALEDDFRRTVLPGADDGAVRLIKQGGSSEVDDSDFIALRHPQRLSLVVLLDQFLFLEQDVFWLEVSMSIAKFMHESNGFEDLSEEALNEFERKSAVVVLFDELIERGTQWLEHEAEMFLVVK